MPLSPEFNMMGKLVAQIYSKADAEPFRDPVDWKNLGLFDYPQIIKRPMDLGQVKRNIDENKYATIHDAADDVRLIWKNCMEYNADGSEFYTLAQTMSKRFEDKYSKLLKEMNIPAVNSEKGKSGDAPTLEEQRSFAKALYRITKEELGKVIVDLDEKCSEALIKSASEDEVEINVDKISPLVFHEVYEYVNSCCNNNNNDGNSRKKKLSSSGKKESKKIRAS